MTHDAVLIGIVEGLSRVIEEEPNFDKRRKLKDARNLVRDVLWGDDSRRGVVAPSATVPDPAANREGHP